MFLTEVVGMSVGEIVQEVISDIIVHCETRTRGDFKEYVIKFFEVWGIKVSHNEGAVEYLVNIIVDKYSLAMR
jgi:hypothetical protein